jgi:hypothetical protein
MILGLVDEAVAAGARRDRACDVMGLTERSAAMAHCRCRRRPARRSTKTSRERSDIGGAREGARVSTATPIRVIRARGSARRKLRSHPLGAVRRVGERG